MMNAEKFLKKIQLKPRPRYLQSSSVRIGVKGNEFLKEIETFVPANYIDLIKDDLNIKLSKSEFTEANEVKQVT